MSPVLCPASSISAVDPHARWGNVHPYALGGLHANAIEPGRDWRDGVVRELHEWRARQHQAEGFKEEAQAHPQRLGKKWQPRYHRRCRLAKKISENGFERISIALNHGRRRIPRPQQPAERGVEFHQHEASRINPLRDQRFGDGTSARPELNDRPGRRGVDVGGHGTRERPARRRDRANPQRFLEPCAEKTHVVVQRFETFFELPFASLDLSLDFSFEGVLSLLEGRNLLLDLSLQRTLPQLENTFLLFKFSFKKLQRWERHW